MRYKLPFSSLAFVQYWILISLFTRLVILRAKICSHIFGCSFPKGVRWGEEDVRFPRDGVIPLQEQQTLLPVSPVYADFPYSFFCDLYLVSKMNTPKVPNGQNNISKEIPHLCHWNLWTCQPWATKGIFQMCSNEGPWQDRLFWIIHLDTLQPQKFLKVEDLGRREGDLKPQLLALKKGGHEPRNGWNFWSRKKARWVCVWGKQDDVLPLELSGRDATLI